MQAPGKRPLAFLDVDSLMPGRRDRVTLTSMQAAKEENLP